MGWLFRIPAYFISLVALLLSTSYAVEHPKAENVNGSQGSHPTAGAGGAAVQPQGGPVPVHGTDGSVVAHHHPDGGVVHKTGVHIHNGEFAVHWLEALLTPKLETEDTEAEKKEDGQDAQIPKEPTKRVEAVVDVIKRIQEHLCKHHPDAETKKECKTCQKYEDHETMHETFKHGDRKGTYAKFIHDLEVAWKKEEKTPLDANAIKLIENPGFGTSYHCAVELLWTAQGKLHAHVKDIETELEGEKTEPAAQEATEDEKHFGHRANVGAEGAEEHEGGQSGAEPAENAEDKANKKTTGGTASGKESQDIDNAIGEENQEETGPSVSKRRRKRQTSSKKPAHHDKHHAAKKHLKGIALLNDLTKDWFKNIKMCEKALGGLLHLWEHLKGHEGHVMHCQIHPHGSHPEGDSAHHGKDKDEKHKKEGQTPNEGAQQPKPEVNQQKPVQTPNVGSGTPDHAHQDKKHHHQV